VIVVDTSALIAVLQGEPETRDFLKVITSDHCVVSTVTVYEAAVVINARRGVAGVTNLLEFIEASGIELRAFSADLMRSAIAAYQSHGRGSGSQHA